MIVPIAKNRLEDMDYDFWTQVKPKVTEAFGKYRSEDTSSAHAARAAAG